MATQLYKVGWDALSLPGWQSIPKASYYSTHTAANTLALALIDAGKVNVYIAPPTQPAVEEMDDFHRRNWEGNAAAAVAFSE